MSRKNAKRASFQAEIQEPRNILSWLVVYETIQTYAP